MNGYYCSNCQSYLLSNEDFVEAGTHLFYHHIRVELLGCPCGRKAIALYYFEEERHGYSDSEHHIGCFIDEKDFLEFKNIMQNTPEIFRDLPNKTPYVFDDFFTMPIKREAVFLLQTTRDERELTNCTEHDRHTVLTP